MAFGLAWAMHLNPVFFVGVVLIVLVWALLFFLGIEVGENEKIIGSLQNLGLEALLLSVAATAGSIACAWALWRYIQRKEGGRQ